MGRIILPAELPQVVSLERGKGNKVGVGTGHFDLGHLGHAKFLEECRRNDAILIAIVGSDWQVSRIKGKGRPYFPAFVRAATVAEFGPDYVAIDRHRNLYQALTHEAIIEMIKPDYWVTPANGNAADLRKIIAARLGIELILSSREPPDVFPNGVSSSDLIAQIDNEIATVFHPPFK